MEERIHSLATRLWEDADDPAQDVEDFQQNLLLWRHVLGAEDFEDLLTWYEEELV